MPRLQEMAETRLAERKQTDITLYLFQVAGKEPDPLAPKVLDQGRSIFRTTRDPDERRKRLTQAIFLTETKTFPDQDRAPVEDRIQHVYEFLTKEEQKDLIRRDLEELEHRQGAGGKKGGRRS
jgi:translation initiation factor IF-3